MPLTIPHDLSNLTPADASQLQANFTAIETYINSELVARDGSIAMVNGLLLPGNPTSTNQAANKGYVDAVVPVGVMLPFGGGVAPTNYLLCQGQAIARGTYAALFAAIGTAFGAGDGTTTFNLPDMRGRYPIGFNQGGDYMAIGVGEKYGNKDATLPSHTHVTPQHLHSLNVNTGTESNFHTHGSVFPYLTGGLDPAQQFRTGTTAPTLAYSTAASTGNNTELHTHNVSGHTSWADRTLTTTAAGTSATNANLPPSVSLNFIIKAL